MAILKNPSQNCVLQLILLFKYSDENFYARRRAVTLTFAHDTQLIMLLLMRCQLSWNSSFSRGQEAMIIETIEIC